MKIERTSAESQIKEGFETINRESIRLILSKNKTKP